MASVLECPQEVQDLVVSLIQKQGALSYKDRNFELECLGSDHKDMCLRQLQVLPTRQCYSGEWRIVDDQLMRQGYGVLVWPDGSLYEGYIVGDRVNGYGRLIHADGDQYEGQWCNDQAHGFGTYRHANGALHRGFWAHDKQNGPGFEMWPNKSSFVCEYVDGKKTG